jgi:hypothetical protein
MVLSRPLVGLIPGEEFGARPRGIQNAYNALMGNVLQWPGGLVV